MSGRTTSARAIANRWRWPPDTFVPPCVISLSMPSGIACTNPRLRDLGASQRISIGGVRPSETQVRRHGAENRYARCGT